MIRPLTPLDDQLARHRGVAKAAARQLLRRFARCHAEDLEAACWAGVHRGLDNVLSGRASVTHLRNYLRECARRAGANEARKWNRAGVRNLPRGVRLDVVPLAVGSDEGASEGANEPAAVCPGPPAGWPESRWASVLSRLPPRVAEVVGLRTRGGLSFPEIAERMGYESAHSAASAFRRAVAGLRDDAWLREQWEE
jgi:DNA-directed RNA polymerase specialized sigma24 family protein